MKKYYYVKLYQASKTTGYIKEGTYISGVIDGMGGIPEVESYEFMEIETIIVEKYSPFLVREIKTGIVFPIVNIKTTAIYIHPIYSIEHPLYESHTFIFSKGDKILGKEITSLTEIQKYNRKHPDNNQFKKDLQAITNIGKTNMDNKIQEELKEMKKENVRIRKP